MPVALVCYELTQSRGAPVAKSLFGQDTDHPVQGVRISDEYSSYRNPQLPGTTNQRAVAARASTGRPTGSTGTWGTGQTYQA